MLYPNPYVLTLQKDGQRRMYSKGQGEGQEGQRCKAQEKESTKVSTICIFHVVNNKCFLYFLSGHLSDVYMY